MTVLEKHRELFGQEPNKKVKEFMEKIGHPKEKMKEILSLIKDITQAMKEELDERDLC